MTDGEYRHNDTWLAWITEGHGIHLSTLTAIKRLGGVYRYRMTSNFVASTPMQRLKNIRRHFVPVNSYPVSSSFKV